MRIADIQNRLDMVLRHDLAPVAVTVAGTVVLIAAGFFSTILPSDCQNNPCMTLNTAFMARFLLHTIVYLPLGALMGYEIFQELAH